jgi:hypothetical protein
MPRIQPKAPFDLRLAQEALRVKEQKNLSRKVGSVNFCPARLGN